MTGYGTYPAPRSCPICGHDWTQLVDRPGRQTHHDSICARCRAGLAAPRRALQLPRLRIPTGEWVELANCASTDPEIFFPEPGVSPKPAQKVCSRCPVIDQCRTWALETREPHGIWGGLTPHQRHHQWRDTA